MMYGCTPSHIHYYAQEVAVHTVAWHDTDGKVMLIGDCEPGKEGLISGSSGFVVVSGDRPRPDDVYVLDGKLHSKPCRPSRYHEWDMSNKCWVGNVEEARSARRRDINDARIVAEQGGFAYLGKVFQSDDKSLGRLLMAVQAGITKEWTCKDNSVIVLTPSDLSGIPAVIDAHNAAIHARAQQRKAEIDAASTVEQVMSVAW